MSSINSYITSLADSISTKSPIFFNSSFLYSLSTNLISGNYLDSIITEGDLTTSTYLVPYQSYTQLETAKIVTIYNSSELADVAIGTSDNGYQIIVQVPSSFVNENAKLGDNIKINITIDLHP